MGLWSRIIGRYLVGLIVGLMAYANLPPEVIAMIKNDPEITTGVTLAVAGAIEWVTTVARRRGWLT